MSTIIFQHKFRVGLLALLAISCFTAASPAFSRSSFTLFESGQVRPLVLSPDGKHLYAVNTPDNRLEIFDVSKHGLKRAGSVPVGLEPVAVAARSNTEVWVVNHLSDSVSVVDLRPGHVPHVVRTLLVGDEPRDIVFAGELHSRAFITTAHRGQNTGRDPQLTTEGIGRADVWVFDANNLGGSLEGDELTVITLFTDTPRALAATPDGSRVYAAGFATGNRTTAISEDVVTRHGGLPPPPISPFPPQVPTGLVVKYDGTHWVDELLRNWDPYVMFSLPDKDVFIIDANANPPAQLSDPIGYYQGVGTMLFNMVVNPVNGHVYVSNTDAQNAKRFEGISAQDSVRGHLAESRISVLTSTSVLSRHLNKHIDYSQCCAPIPNEENTKSVAFPQDMAISGNGSLLYVGMFGTSEVGIYKTAELENNTFIPDTANQIRVRGGGPSGLALDEAKGRLYVLTRFDNSISIVDTKRRTEIGHIPMFNPEPKSVVKGRRFLYDASFSSSHGDSACASCHVFGDFDSLAWDLGNLDGEKVTNPGPFTLLASRLGLPDSVEFHTTVDFQALKGPMTTQSLRGLANHGPMHWRGDRTGGNDEVSQQPDSGTFDEDVAFKKFNVAFVTLNGRDVQIDDKQMQAFTDFILQITYPPNPIRNLDNSLTPDQQAGRDFYFGTTKVDTFFNCNECHMLDPKANAEFGVAKPGFFGTDGRYSFENEPQMFKIPHLRNMYQKVGKFGMPESSQQLPPFPITFNDSNIFLGDQIKGFGFLHDGSIDTVFRFFNLRVFAPRPPGTASSIDPGNHGFPLDANGLLLRKQMEQFVLAFDSNLAPIVGQQITLTKQNDDVVGPRINLLMARADKGECDLVVKNRLGGFLYVGDGKFRSSRHRALTISDAHLRYTALLPDGEITYTCMPPGSGLRIGMNRDEEVVPDDNDRDTRRD
jgi:DNA-binding beta-propeller fold protein YncE